MISPYVRRLRLARELEALLERAGVSQTELARMIGENRRKISELLNAKVRPRQDDIMRILEALGVSGDEWSTIMRIADEAASRGWWESSARRMGQRQALRADLEAGATRIREYQPVIPGLVQTAEFIDAVIEYDDLSLPGPSPTSPEAVKRARSGRQRMLRRPGGPSYEVILDELAVRRWSVPPRVLADQLRALADVGNERVTVRVLPIDARIESYSLPTSAFSLYNYADPGDPLVVAVDTVTTDHVLIAPDETGPYEQLFTRLHRAALSGQDSAGLLLQAADEMESEP